MQLFNVGRPSQDRWSGLEIRQLFLKAFQLVPAFSKCLLLLVCLLLSISNAFGKVSRKFWDVCQLRKTPLSFSQPRG